MNDTSNYPALVAEIIQYIDEFKSKTDIEISLIDIIGDFAFERDYDINLIGDAIASDVYLKSYIKKDCEHHRIFQTKKKFDNW